MEEQAPGLLGDKSRERKSLLYNKIKHEEEEM